MQTKPRKGRPTNTERDQILATYHESRAKGLSQKDSGKLAGINEKTAGKYERAIQEAKNKKIERLQINIFLLKKYAMISDFVHI